MSIHLFKTHPLAKAGLKKTRKGIFMGKFLRSLLPVPHITPLSAVTGNGGRGFFGGLQNLIPHP